MFVRQIEADQQTGFASTHNTVGQHLKVIRCGKDVKDSFIVDKKVSAVDGIQYNLQSSC